MTSLTSKERGRLARLKDRCHVLQARIDSGTAGTQDWVQELSALSWAIAKIEAFTEKSDEELLRTLQAGLLKSGWQPPVALAPEERAHKCKARETIEYAITLLEVHGGNPKVIEYLRAGLDQHEAAPPMNIERDK